ncbi:MAG TPA: 3-phosphoshikimate 1-carboxyvinyltransferase [Candidatus Faecalibacterium faecigallinarum]|uniref:3-phosphoshikimate 1-carboxyvinyltransferase n=1 Tax=Candidatus Faecalibacterium faecigallinarum TaxID=2838577 RepID=A0A9D2P8Q0_9FIRM|nr:3-phosphoshikimate 1-carboxyvinyltransferase [Candidatus Faecalibacterium faecigallinarum]
MTVYIRPGPPPSGVLAAPPSKSMAHRAVLCAALADGESRLTGLAHSQDIDATLAAAAALGAQVEAGESWARIAGAAPLQAPAAPVDCCESGSTLRFLIPLAALTGRPVAFTGRGRLMQRPQSVYQELFASQGLRFEQEGDTLTVAGPLRPGCFSLAGDVSSQFISGLLFALPLLDGDSRLCLKPPVESRSYIEMTRAAQSRFGVASAWLDEYTLAVPGGQAYRPRDMAIEGDWSQAAFPAALGVLAGDVTVTGLEPGTLQGDAVILDILRRCGGRAEAVPGGVRFQKSALHGTKIDLADCPDLGPILMALGLLCEGETVITNAGRLRLKESDRIAAMEQELRKLGGRIESDGGTVTVRRSALHAPAGPLWGHNDHRVVMSLTVLAAAAGLPVQIDGAEAVAKSWPGFFAAVRQLGVEVQTDA